MRNDELGAPPPRGRPEPGVERGVDASGNGYLAVAGELLVSDDAVDDVVGAVEQVARSRARDRGRIDDEVTPVDAGGRVVRLQFAADPADSERPRPAPIQEVLDGVRALLAGRRAGGDRPVPRVVAPNHVFCGEGHYSGGPADIVVPALAEMAAPAQPVGSGVRVEVLDTGLVEDHSWFLGGGGAIDAQSVEGLTEPADIDGDLVLDAQAGHGTFVSGVVAQQAPAAQIATRAVLNSYGYGSEHDIAAAIRQAAADFDADGNDWLVLNLSLGGYTEGDLPPLAILDALDLLDPAVVVVAAAGNDHPNCGRPFFPAALKRVLAVGAIDDLRAPAPFSNRGPWVDACTRGVGVVSSFFPAFNGQVGGVPDPDDFKGLAIWSGTSFAAPRVAGKVAAVLSGQVPDGGEIEVRHLLRRHGHVSAGGFTPSATPVTLPDLGMVIP